MQQRPMVMSKGTMIGATERSKARVNTWLELAQQVSTDARKDERIKNQKCRACFYSTRIGGAAMTTRPCMCCCEEQMYGSTATDVLCVKCATDNDLCKCCGGDIEMRARRVEWPSPMNADR